MYTTNVIVTNQLFSNIAFAFVACGVSTWGKCQRELSLTNSSTCFWRSRSSAKRSTISMRSLLSSCKRMKSHKPSEEGVHLVHSCLSSIFERLCRHIFALRMCALRLMGLCQRRWWHRRLRTDPSPMLRGLEFWGFHQYLFSAQLLWCILSWSASPPTGGQGCYAALFSLRPYLDKPGRCDLGTQRHHTRNHNKCLSLDDTWRSWDCLGGRPLWLCCIVCIRLEASWSVHYPITNSCPLGKRLKSISIIDWVT